MKDEDAPVTMKKAEKRLQSERAAEFVLCTTVGPTPVSILRASNRASHGRSENNAVLQLAIPSSSAGSAPPIKEAQSLRGETGAARA